MSQLTIRSSSRAGYFVLLVTSEEKSLCLTTLPLMFDFLRCHSTTSSDKTGRDCMPSQSHDMLSLKGES